MNKYLKIVINILELNNIKFIISDYAGKESINIKNSKYQLFIYYDNSFVSDFQKVPYTWGFMGSTTLEDIINNLEIMFNKKIIYQLNLFEVL